MQAARQVVAFGGGGFSQESGNPLLDDYVLGLTGTADPRVCFLPTASGDADHYVVRFYNAFRDRARPSHVSLFRRERGVPDIRSHLLAQDVIYVGGGSLISLLGVWRAHGIDSMLREAHEAGVILCGLSAGSLCWFAEAVSGYHGEVNRVPRAGLSPPQQRSPLLRRRSTRRLPPPSARRDARRLRRRGRRRPALRGGRAGRGRRLTARGPRLQAGAAREPGPRDEAGDQISGRGDASRRGAPRAPGGVGASVGTRRILALGGHDFDRRAGNDAICDLIVELAESPRPKICLLPTASGDPEDQIARFRRSFAERDCDSGGDLAIPAGREPDRPSRGAPGPGRDLRGRRKPGQPRRDLAGPWPRPHPAGVLARGDPDLRTERGRDGLVPWRRSPARRGSPRSPADWASSPEAPASTT